MQAWGLMHGATEDGASTDGEARADRASTELFTQCNASSDTVQAFELTHGASAVEDDEGVGDGMSGGTSISRTMF